MRRAALGLALLLAGRRLLLVLLQPRVHHRHRVLHGGGVQAAQVLVRQAGGRGQQCRLHIAAHRQGLLERRPGGRQPGWGAHRGRCQLRERLGAPPGRLGRQVGVGNNAGGREGADGLFAR